MKILKHGKKYDPDWVYKVTCSECDGEYEFDKHDLEIISLGEDGSSSGFRCPNADCMNFIDAPDWVRSFSKKYFHTGNGLHGRRPTQRIPYGYNEPPEKVVPPKRIPPATPSVKSRRQ